MVNKSQLAHAESVHHELKPFQVLSLISFIKRRHAIMHYIIMKGLSFNSELSGNISEHHYSLRFRLTVNPIFHTSFGKMCCEQSRSLVNNKDLARALMFTRINNIAILARTCAISHVSASTWKLLFPLLCTHSMLCMQRVIKL